MVCTYNFNMCANLYVKVYKKTNLINNLRVTDKIRHEHKSL